MTKTKSYFNHIGCVYAVRTQNKSDTQKFRINERDNNMTPRPG